MSDVAIKRDLDLLYAELPHLDCQQKCAESCGPIWMGRVEWERIQKKLRCTPVAASISCPMLKNDLCSVYAIRPMLCRLWGIVESMPCPWGCVPERWLTDEEGYDFLARASRLQDDVHVSHPAAEYATLVP